jgi:uncharacterized phage infection (PIP) family protein YhgE
MASGKRSREIDDTERARSMPEAEATALSTVAMTMFLSVLAEAEAAKRQQLNALQPDQTAPQATPPPAASQAVTAAPADTSSPPQPEQHPADGATTEAPPAHPLFASLAEPSHVSEADQQQSDESATANAWQSADHLATTSGFVPDLHVSNPTDSSSWTGPAGHAATSTTHDLAGPAPGLDLADGLHDIMGRLTTTISDISTDLQHQLASVTSGLSNLTTAITSDLSHLNTTISDTVASVTHAAASIPAGVADALVSGVFGSAPQSPVPNLTDHDLPMLDTGGIIPVSLDHTPLQLGFLGQAHVEGHDPHDGAFSALGIH